MYRSLVTCAALVLLVAAGVVGRTSPAFSDPPGGLPTTSTPESGHRPMAFPNNVPAPDVGSLAVPLPPRPPVYQSSPLPQAPAVGALNEPRSGPITGYGPGGMGREPGMPSNPPWSYGGTTPLLR